MVVGGVLILSDNLSLGSLLSFAGSQATETLALLLKSHEDLQDSDGTPAGGGPGLSS